MTVTSIRDTLPAALAALALCSAAFGQPPAGPAKAPTTQAGNPAAGWLRRAQGDLGNIVEAREQGQASWDVVRMWVRGGDKAAARELADEILLLPHRRYFQQVLAGEQARRGEFAPATQAAAGIEDEQDRAGAVIEIIQALALAGDVQGATRLADEFSSNTWLIRSYGEIAAAQGHNGDYAGARATANALCEKIAAATARNLPAGPNNQPLPNVRPDTPGAAPAASPEARAAEDRKAASTMRDRILAAVAEMQGLAGDPDGAQETAGFIKEQILREMTKTAVVDNKEEAAFLKAWKALAGSERWPLPASDILDPSFRSMLFEDLLSAISAKDEAAYNKAIRDAAGDTSRHTMGNRKPRMAHDITGRFRMPMPQQPDSTIIERALAYTHIAVVEAARNDIKGALSIARVAKETGEAEQLNDFFTGTCGPILVAVQIKAGDTRGGIDYALGLAKGHVHAGPVARALGFALAEKGQLKELHDDYLAKTDNPGHRVQACLGAASFLIDSKKPPGGKPRP